MKKVRITIKDIPLGDNRAGLQFWSSWSQTFLSSNYVTSQCSGHRDTGKKNLTHRHILKIKKKKWNRTHIRKTCVSIASQIFQLNWIKEQNITASQIALHIPSSLFALYNLWCHSSVLPVFLNFIYMEIYKLYSTQSTGLTFPRIQMESVS